MVAVGWTRKTGGFSILPVPVALLPLLPLPWLSRFRFFLLDVDVDGMTSVCRANSWKLLLPLPVAFAVAEVVASKGRRKSKLIRINIYIYIYNY